MDLYFRKNLPEFLTITVDWKHEKGKKWLLKCMEKNSIGKIDANFFFGSMLLAIFVPAVGQITPKNEEKLSLFQFPMA